MQRTAGRQRGAVTLAIVLVLLLVMLTMGAFAARNLMLDQKTAAGLPRHAQAFEAAEAGLQWAAVMLQSPRLDALCLPAESADARGFRDRYLQVEATSGRWTPVAGPAPGCALEVEGPRCACPWAGGTTLAPSDAPAFALQFAPVPRPGLIEVTARGCSTAAAPCADTSATADAVASTSALFALAPALRTQPAAALTARGNVDLGGVPARFVNADAASAGVTLNAGGALTGDAFASFSTAAGARAPGSAIAADASLAALRPGALFVLHFGLDRPTYTRLPGVVRLTCADCTAALAAAYERGARMFWIDGDLTLAGPMPLGSVSDPVLLAAAGSVQLAAGARVHGVVYSGAATWRLGGASAGTQIHGAALAEGHVLADGAAPLFVRDARVLAHLQSVAGTFVRVAGSWRDFP